MGKLDFLGKAVAEYTINSADTWEKKTVTFTASPSAGTWLYTTGIGAILIFPLMAGSNFTTSTLNTWNSDTKWASTNQVNFLDSNTATFFLTGVQLELGSTDTPFDYIKWGEELARCQRYYWKSFPYATAPAQNTAVTIGVLAVELPVTNSSPSIAVRFPVSMRVAPTITTYSPNAANAAWYVHGIGIGPVVSTTTLISADGWFLGTGATTSGGGNVIIIHAAADAEL